MNIEPKRLRVIGTPPNALPSRPASRPTSKAATPSCVSRCLADIEAVPIAWLWPQRLALGKLNLIAGQPGLGKSQLTGLFAARVTTGDRWPDGGRCPTGNVIFVSCEDDAADTIVPRLDAAGADRTRVHILDWIEEVTRRVT